MTTKHAARPLFSGPRTSPATPTTSAICRSSRGSRSLNPDHAGILASAVAAHARVLGEQVKRSASAPSAYVGAVGEKHIFGRVALERVITLEGGNYGPAHIHTFRDAAGNAIVWRTAEVRGAAGDVFTMTGTIKNHSEFRGEKQTEVTRCKLYRNDQEVK
jgi:hypothetical protein